MTLATYTRERLIKATRGGARSRDATFTAVGGSLRTLATRSFSLLQGIERPGWAVGVDGYTARMLDSSPASLLGQLSLNEIVYACMRERMKVLITPAFLVERRQADGTYVVDDRHELTSLLRRPGPNLDAPTLWRCLEASYASIGRLYLEPIYSARPRMLRGLNPLNPIYIQERYEYGRLVAYDWQPPDAPSIRFGVDDLIVRRAVDWADVPPLIAALGAVEADQLSNDFMRGFFANAGVPSGIVKVRGSWSQTLTDAFRSTWMERFGPGGMSAGGPAIFDENIESYTRLGVSLNELDNETLRMFIETRICMCFGVPPLIIYAYAGLLKATYSNLQEAWSSFWDATALPLLKEWAEWINWSLLTLYEDPDDVLLGNVRCRFDPTGLGPYQEDVDAKVQLYSDAYDKGAITMNELRLVMGLSEHPDGDVFKAPPSPPVPWQLPPDDPQAAPSEIEPPEDEEKRLPVVHNVKAAPKPPQRLEGDVEKYLRDQYAKARRLVLAGASIDAIEDELDAGIALFGILAVAERKAYADAWRAAVQRLDWEVALAADDVTAAVDLLAGRTTAIADTTKADITAVIVAALAARQTEAAIAAALGELGVKRSKERAPMIVQTETQTAHVTGATDAYKASGIVGSLVWSAHPDACDECKDRDGQTYDLATAPDLPAHVNCRCDWSPEVATEVSLAAT